MLDLAAIEGQYKTSEKVVRIEAWDGDVKIRQLTVAESAEVMAAQSSGDAALAMVKTASFALVEPKLSEKKIKALPQESFEAIGEIVEAVGALSEPKK